MSKTIKELYDSFNKKWKKVKRQNKNVSYHKDKIMENPDWKEFIIRPIVKALCEVGGYKMENEELRQFGLRSHVPVTLIGKDDALYLDLSHNGGFLMITDFTAEPTENYPSNSIGKINGFDLGQVEFSEDQTIDDVVNYVLNNKEKFLINLEQEA